MEDIKPVSEGLREFILDLVRKVEANGLKVPDWVYEEYQIERAPRS
jgi:hypothetical protein